MIALALALGGCGGAQEGASGAVQAESPEDAILRIGSVWQASSNAKGLRSAPDPVSVFEVKTTSTIRFSRGKRSAVEQIVVRERFELRSGATFLCETAAKLENGAEFARYHGEPAVELRRPATALERSCDPAGFRGAELEIPASAARFVLKSDQLVPFAPPLEKRIYLPIE